MDLFYYYFPKIRPLLEVMIEGSKAPYTPPKGGALNQTLLILVSKNSYSQTEAV